MVIRLWRKRCRPLRTFRETSGFRKRADFKFRLKSSRERLAVRKVPWIIHVFLRQVPILLSSRTLRITLNPDFLFEPRYDLGKSPWVDYTLITNRWNIFRRAVELVWSRSRILILAFARQALFFFSDEHPLTSTICRCRVLIFMMLWFTTRFFKLSAELLVSVPFARFIIYNCILLKHQLNYLIHEDQNSAKSKNYQLSTLSPVAMLCCKTRRMLSIYNTTEDETRGCTLGKVLAIQRTMVMCASYWSLVIFHLPRGQIEGKVDLK